MNERFIRKLYILLAFIVCCLLVGCVSQGELFSTVHFTDEITGRTFVRETWEVNSFPGGISHRVRFYEIRDGFPARKRVEHLLYERIPNTVYGGIELHHPRHSGRYNVTLSEPVPFSLSLDGVRVYFTRVSAGLDVNFSFCINEQSFYFSSLTSGAWGARSWVRTNSFELEMNEEQLQDILRSLEHAEQVLRTDRHTLAADEYYWDIRITSNHHTTFFYIDGDATYQLLRALMYHPLYLADSAEVARLQEVYNESRLNIQETRIAGTVAWHEKNDSWDRNAEPEVREAAQAELRSIREYYDARVQVYFEEGLQNLAAAYEDSRSNVSFEYLGFKMTLIAIFERAT